MGLGDPTLGAAVDQDGLRGFVENADRDPDVLFGGVKQSVEAEGRGYTQKGGQAPASAEPVPGALRQALRASLGLTPRAWPMAS